MSRSVPEYLFYSRLAEWLQTFPAAYLAVQRFRYRNVRFSERIVTESHALMIEGFPRSGTSFAVEAMLSANPDLQGRLATHLHAPAHLVEAVRLGVPAMVHLRHPRDAVTSMAALAEQVGAVDIMQASHEQKSAVMAFLTRRYVTFNRCVRELSDRLMIVTFEEVVSDYGAVIERCNSRFGLELNSFDHSQSAQEHIFRKSKVHLSPNAQRNEFKALMQEYFDAGENAQNRTLAVAMYEDCRGLVQA